MICLIHFEQARSKCILETSEQFLHCIEVWFSAYFGFAVDMDVEKTYSLSSCFMLHICSSVFFSEAMWSKSAAAGQGGSSLQSAGLPPPEPSAPPPDHQVGPVEGTVIEIAKQKFVQPSVPEMPGTSVPYLSDLGHSESNGPAKLHCNWRRNYPVWILRQHRKEH